MTAEIAARLGRTSRSLRRRRTAADLSIDVDELAGHMRRLIERMDAGSGGLPDEWADVAARFREVARDAARLGSRLTRSSWAGLDELQGVADLEARVAGLADWAEQIATVEGAVPGTWPAGPLEEAARRRIRHARAFVLTHPPTS